MKAGVVVLNFGEPEHATLEEVVPFLEKIFMINASLERSKRASATPGGGAPSTAESEPEDHAAYERALQRSKHLAGERAPGLIEELNQIGGSPLHAQARAEAQALQHELTTRGHEVKTYIGMQFTQPGIAEAVADAKADGVERLIGLPAYPLCGPSTTIAGLADLSAAVAAADWDVELREITGWHAHPLYTELRADAIGRIAEANQLDLNEAGTKLVFSAHGTPIKYLSEGSRYQGYVVDSCRRLADALGVRDYLIGYQNHTNRPGVQWTQPDVQKVVEDVRAHTIVVDPISFMHEQSETLSELDHDLRTKAESRGLRFFRVPIPHADPRLAVVLADLVEPLICDRDVEAGLRPCRCRERPGVYCLNR